MRELLAISDLPPGYDVRRFRAFCEDEAQKARALMLSERDANNHPPATPTTVSSPSVAPTIRRARDCTAATVSSDRTVGRPRLERTVVLVVLFPKVRNHPGMPIPEADHARRTTHLQSAFKPKALLMVP